MLLRYQRNRSEAADISTISLAKNWKNIWLNIARFARLTLDVDSVLKHTALTLGSKIHANYEPATQLSNYKLFTTTYTSQAICSNFLLSNPLFLAKSEAPFRQINLALPHCQLHNCLNGTRVVGDSLSLPNDQNKILNMKKQHTFRGSRTTYIISFTPHPRRGRTC